MKRLTFIAVTMCVSLSILVGCATVSNTETPSTPPTIEPLEIMSITPDILHVDGGTVVSISGGGFNSGTIVYVTQRAQVKEANNVFASSPTEILCRMPPHAIGFAHVTVANEDGSRATLENAVIYTKLGFDRALVTRALVVRVIDGDTIEVKIGDRLYNVRYIGIDTPETVHPTQGEEPYGREAYEKNRELVEDKVVLLEKDMSETDQYGRLLRYVYIDDKFVNAELVKLGYAQVTTYPPDVKYQNLFLELQRGAKENGVGLWGIESSAPTGGPINVKITKIFYDGLVPHVESDEYVEITNLGNEAVDLANWMLTDISEGYPAFTFPSYVLKPGGSVRVYTNEIHLEHGGFSFKFQEAIWNNSEPDVAALYNAQGIEVSRKSY